MSSFDIGCQTDKLKALVSDAQASYKLSVICLFGEIWEVQSACLIIRLTGLLSRGIAIF